MDPHTGGDYHLQILTPLGPSKRLSHRMFSRWVIHLHDLGCELSIEYDHKHKVYMATAMETPSTRELMFPGSNRNQEAIEESA